jgi:hypothetical protein
MGLFFKVTDKISFDTRKRIFEDKGIPLLTKIGFEKTPFINRWFGKYNRNLNIYELCRLTDSSQLQMVIVYISRGDKWIQIHLNIFQLDNSVKSLSQLSSFKGDNFNRPPNSISLMRLNTGDFKGIPLLNIDFMFRNHKLNSSFTKWGYNRSAKKLERRIINDFSNFEKFIGRWNSLFKPLKTTADGEIVGLKNMTLNERLEVTRLKDRFKEAKIKHKQHAENMLRWIEIEESKIKRIIETAS